MSFSWRSQDAESRKMNTMTILQDNCKKCYRKALKWIPEILIKMSKQCSEAVLRIRANGQRWHRWSTKTSRTFGKDVTNARRIQHGRSTQISRTPEKDVTDARHKHHGHPTKMSWTFGADMTNTRKIYHGESTQISWTPVEDVTDARQAMHGRSSNW